MVNVLISGANGRMGKKVLEACLLNPNVKAVCGVDIEENLTNKDFPIYSSFSGVQENIDVIIDFSSPLALDSILSFAKANNCGVVLCSTGYSKEEIEKINAYSKEITLFRSANMSLGANVLIEAVKKVTSLLSDFDVEIIEKHHNQKVDAPSGTALMLADAVKEVLTEKYYTFGREGKVGKRKENEIGIHAVRGGNIVGEHDVLFAGLNETVTLSHTATDRSVFAIGAVKAAIFIKDKSSGLYNMQDLING